MFLIISLTLQDIDSLALKNASEIINLREQLFSLEEEYKSLLFSFSPSLYLKGSYPYQYEYYDELFYPGSSSPIEYIEKHYKKMLGIGGGTKVPFGGMIDLSFDLDKIKEEYNIYEDREYYKSEFLITYTQPILGVSQEWDKIRGKKIEIEKLKVNIKMKEREIIKSVRMNFSAIFFYLMLKDVIPVIKKNIEYLQDEIEYLYKEKTIDKTHYLKSKNEILNTFMKISNIEDDYNDAMFEIKRITGLDDFLIENISFDFKTFPDTIIIPDEYLVLSELKLDREIYSIMLSQKKRELIPSFNLSLSYGFKDRKEEISELNLFNKNTYYLNLDMRLPLLSPSLYFEISSLEHRLKGLDKIIRDKEKEIDFVREKLIKRKNNIEKRLTIIDRTMRNTIELLHEEDLKSLSPEERISFLLNTIDILGQYKNVIQEYLLISIYFRMEDI